MANFGQTNTERFNINACMGGEFENGMDLTYQTCPKPTHLPLKRCSSFHFLQHQSACLCLGSKLLLKLLELVLNQRSAFS